jgi:hypothetical protein
MPTLLSTLYSHQNEKIPNLVLLQPGGIHWCIPPERLKQ